MANGGREGFCDACFTGKYPVEIPKNLGPAQLHLFDAADHANGAAGQHR
jgi:hypothetical protein